MDGSLENDNAPPPAACRNCGARATGHFCPNCGQETRVALPTFGAFMREAAGRYVAMDGRLWRTLFALVARPGFLTQEYYAGRRRRYIRPARLFLVLYLLLFAVIGLLQSPGNLADEVVFVDSEEAAQAMKREIQAERSQAREAGPTVSGVESDDGSTVFGFDRDLNLTLRLGGEDLPLPPQLRKRYDQFKKLSKEEKAERLYAGILRYGPYAMVVMLPAFALLLKLAYLGRGQRYPGRPTRYAEHLVYSAHMHAFAAVMLLALVLVPWGIVHLALALWIVYYAVRARQAVYGGRWWGGLARALVVGTVYLVLLGFAMLGLLAMAIMLR